MFLLQHASISSVCVASTVPVGQEEHGAICGHCESHLTSIAALACVFQPYRKELERERASRVRVEQDLDEATQRLLMAHKEIQRLTDELAAQGKEQSRVGKSSYCGCVPLLVTSWHLAQPCLLQALPFLGRIVGERLSCL